MSLSPFVPTPDFAEYSARFKDHFLMERRADGVLLVKAHTQGGSLQLSVENHRALGQMLKTVGADPKNEVLILTGSGDDFMMKIDPEGFALEHQDLRHWAYEYAYKDGRINVGAELIEQRITLPGGPTQGAITTFKLIVDVPDVIEQHLDLDLPAAASRITPLKTYRAIKTVRFDLQDDGGSAVNVRIIDRDPTLGPLVQPITSAMAGTTARVNATIQGY